MTENQIKAKRFLLHVANLPNEIESKMLEIEVMRTRAEGLGAIRYDKDRVQTSPQDTMSEAIIKLIEFIDKLEADHIRLVQERDKADGIMEYLTTNQRDIIDYYFFQHRNFYQISRKMHYSERQVKRHFYEGLEVFGANM